MSQTVNVGEAKAQLSRLIAQAEAGEDVVIARDGVPAVRIVPVERPIAETVALIRQERARRPRVPATEIRAAKEEGRT